MIISIIFVILSALYCTVLAMNPITFKNPINQGSKIARIPLGKRPDLRVKSLSQDVGSYFGRKEVLGTSEKARPQRPNTIKKEPGYLFAIGYDSNSPITHNINVCNSFYHPGMIKMAQPQVPSWEVNDLYSKVLSGDPKTAKSCLISLFEIDGLSFADDLDETPFHYTAALIPKHSKYSELESAIVMAKDDQNNWSLELPNGSIIKIKSIPYPKHTTETILTSIGEEITGNAYRFVEIDGFSRSTDLSKSIRFVAAIIPRYDKNNQFEPPLFIARNENNHWSLKLPNCTILTFDPKSYPQQSIKEFLAGIGQEITGNPYDFVGYFKVPKDFSTKLSSFGINLKKEPIQPIQSRPLMTQSIAEEKGDSKETENQINLPDRQHRYNPVHFQKNNKFQVKVPVVFQIPEVGDLNYKGLGQLMNSPYFYAIDAKNHKELSGHPGVFKFTCPECNQRMIDSLNKKAYYDDEMETSCASIKSLLLIDGHWIVYSIPKLEIYEPFNHYIVVIVPNPATLNSATNEPRFYRLNKGGKWSYKAYMQPEEIINQDPFKDFDQAIDVLKQNTNNGDCMVAGIFKIEQSFKEKVKKLMNYL